MHSVTVRKEIVDRVLQRRGRYHLFDRLDPARTALIVIDMQHTFCAPGGPAEVPASRDIVEPINRLTAELRSLAVPVIWVLHANSRIGGKSDWELFFNTIVADDGQGKNAGESGCRQAKRMGWARHRANRPHGAKKSLQCADPGLVSARAHASRHGDRHHSHRRHQDERMLRINGT